MREIAGRSTSGRLVLIAAAAIFLGRVVAQFVQAVATVDVLPAFDAWQSGALPYGALFVSQLVILGVQGFVISRVLAGRYQLGAGVRRGLLLAGLAYLGFMVIRLIVGFTLADDGSWFDAPLPSIFHIVLATFVLAAACAGADGIER